MQSESNPRRQAVIGCLFATLGFGFWGLNPIYFKAVGEVPALELLAHRVLWSVPLLAVMVSLAGGWQRIAAALRRRAVLLPMLATTLILSVNWLLFILAIQNDRILEASLGYYMNPIFMVFLGMVFLRERLRRTQVLALTVAALGVLNLIVLSGEIPWFGLGLMTTFGIYGLLRKVMPLGSVEGLFLETCIMLPPALLWLFYLGWTGNGSFLGGGWSLDLLIIAAGPVTALPLVWFASGARRLKYATLGLFQFIAPSLQFLLGVLVYEEPFGDAQLVAFACIWSACGLYAVDGLRNARHR